MNYRKTLGLLGVLITSIASAQVTVPGWHDSLERAQELSRRKNKPLLIVFRCTR